MSHLGDDEGILARAGIFGRRLITGGNVLGVENLGGDAPDLRLCRRGHHPRGIGQPLRPGEDCDDHSGAWSESASAESLLLA